MQTQYVTDDGKVFTDFYLASNHERDLKRSGLEKLRAENNLLTEIQFENRIHYRWLEIYEGSELEDFYAEYIKSGGKENLWLFDAPEN